MVVYLYSVANEDERAKEVVVYLSTSAFTCTMSVACSDSRFAAGHTVDKDLHANFSIPYAACLQP